MLRKVLLSLGLILLACATSFAQNSTTVSGQITDLGGQSWNNGTFNFVFVPSIVNPVGPYTWPGGAIPANIGGTLNGTGGYSVSIPSNTAISPIQSSWTVTFCPQASSPCVTVRNLAVTGATQTLNATPPAILINLSQSVPPVLAYADSEITGVVLGSQYFNLPGATLKTCTVVSGSNCTTWVSASSTTNATNLVGPGTIGGAYTGTGSLTLPILHGDYVTGTTTYPLTGAGLQSAITAASGIGCVYVVLGTYTMSSTLTIPSNSCIYWDNALVVSNGFSGDLISSTSTSNISFRGKLLIDGSAMGGSIVGHGLDLLTVNNFSFDDIESKNAHNSCIEMLGVSHVRGNKVLLSGCGAGGSSTSANFFIANNSTTPSTDVLIHEVDISSPSGSGLEDGFYVSGTIATPSQRINVDSLILNGCTDSCFEANFSQFINIGKIISVSPFNSHVLLRRGLTDVNVDSVSCSGTASGVCVDIANFQTSDPPMQRINIGKVTASNISKDLVNGAAVRISNSLTTSTISNISIGQIIADTSTRGFYCVATTSAPNAHITVGNLQAHHSKGDGVKLGVSGGCNDIVIGTLLSYDNNIGGTTDHGDAINVSTVAGLTIGASRVFDDQGSKTQNLGININAGSTNVTIGPIDCQDALEVTGCFTDSSAVAVILRRFDSTGKIKIEAATTNPTGYMQSSGISTFAANFFNNTTSTGMGTITTNTAGSADVGTTALPWGNLWLGTAATNNFKFAPSSTTGARIINIPDFGVNASTTQNFPNTVILTSQYTNSTTGFTNVAGGTTLAFPVAANTNYTATCHLYYQAAATGGLNIEFTGPASPTTVAYGLDDPSAATTFNSSVATAFGTSLGQVVGTATTNFDAVVSFSLVNGANAGTVNLLAKSSAAVQLQIQAGSFCRVQ